MCRLRIVASSKQHRDDFDTWSFIDITDAIQKKLESIKSGCKAKSICLLCQGGPGYLYILRKYVITPQKLRKDSYKSVKEFWKALAGQISKLTPSESKIHILGCRMGETKQGTELAFKSEKIFKHSNRGKSVVSLYFNSRRYNVWRSHFDDSDDEVIDFEAEEHAMDETESIPRTWSSLANEVDSDTD
ncbi:hypothetical protein KUTeg_018735 [Tegillarca granosa]|uniref:Uncharacterized protein n=1 Tax=Tegillarca granosa TaxID=220873 RepID=A0ABQ9EEH5_TEGGR|nr:hypothetical protein KUTeg_018735 [Tegillarca granosa]